MFAQLSPRVFAYARRRCDPVTAQDVVSDVFVVAWQRRNQLPLDPLPWQLVVARNTLANRRRHDVRQARLADTVAYLEQVAGPAVSADESVVTRETFLTALATLGELEREALLLVAWDGLSGAAAAQVAGCSQRAFEVRLSRGRARLTRAVAQLTEHDDSSIREGR
jgi:RNA polymerase sigma-70 factor (ECF subfamily)